MSSTCGGGVQYLWAWNGVFGCCGGADNALFYARNQVPFVMGTTGGDREKLMADVHEAGIYAVIAPQMGKQASRGRSFICNRSLKFIKSTTIRQARSHEL
jgi:hypothetical protein